MSLILIDGYNLIRQSSALSTVEAKDFSKGRDALIALLAEYKRVKPHRIVVVFDAGKTDWGHRSADRQSGIEMMYSRSRETADEVIIGMLQDIHGDVIVVSSDNAIIQAAKAHGHFAVGASEFERVVRQALSSAVVSSEDEDDSHRGRLSTKKKGPSRRQPKKARQTANRLKRI